MYVDIVDDEEAVKVTTSPSQKSVLLRAVEDSATWYGAGKFSIANVTLLLDEGTSITPETIAERVIEVVPALINDKSVGHWNSAYPSFFSIVFTAPEEKWEELKIAVAKPEFAPSKVNVTIKLFAVKSIVLVVLKLWTLNSKSTNSLLQYLTSEPSAGMVIYDLSLIFKSADVWEYIFWTKNRKVRKSKFFKIYRYVNLELNKLEQ